MKQYKRKVMDKYKKAKLDHISPKVLETGHNYDFPIYKDLGDSIYAIFLSKDEKLDQDHFEKLQEENIKDLFINHNDHDKYSKEITNYLSKILDDTTQPTLLKSEIMHELASDTMHDLLHSDITVEKIEKVSKTVDDTVHFILNDPKAVKSMLYVTTHDYYTYTHSIDVSTYALGFGAYLGLNETQLRILGKGGMLHDLGKKKIPLEIINKDGKLDDNEFEIMKKHPIYGVKILKEMGETNDMVCTIIEQHHEKLDGTGYPKGLKADKIHPFAQIMAICDIFNALTTKRSYKNALSSFEAFKIMHDYMKDELNLKLLSKFISFMGNN